MPILDVKLHVVMLIGQI